MKKHDEHLKDMTSKDENKAVESIRYLVDSSDVELFKALVKKSEFLFDFVKDNINKRFFKVANANNYRNLIRFFEIYSQDYDELFALILSKFADEDLTDEMLNLLENGSEDQKAYAAKYFVHINDTLAVDVLNEYIFSDSDSLSYNAAQALGKMKDKASYDKALDLLKKDDDFDKLKAVKFFCAYAYNPPINDIFEAMKSSNMPENIAGEIPYVVSLVMLFDTEHKKNVLITVDNIISGLSEILPLSQIFQFEIYDLLSLLIETNKSENQYYSLISKILLRALLKFQIISNNDEYIFDEDKNTKQELFAIVKLLEEQSFDFWQKQKSEVIKELSHCKHRILGALEVIKEFKLIESIVELHKLLENNDEVIICETIATLKELEALDKVDQQLVLNKINDENIKAIVENYWR